MNIDPGWQNRIWVYRVASFEGGMWYNSSIKSASPRAANTGDMSHRSKPVTIPHDTSDSNSIQSAEIWKAIPGYESLYEVSSFGRVRNASGRILKCWVAGNMRSTGYLYVQLSKNKNPKKWLIHRLVAMAFLGEVGGLEVNHLDGDHFNNALLNLEIVTRVQNVEHAVRTGLAVFGERQGSSILTERDVLSIKAKHDLGFSRSELASEYGISSKYVRSVILSETWKHIPPSSVKHHYVGQLIPLNDLVDVYNCIESRSTNLGIGIDDLCSRLSIPEHKVRRLLKRLNEIGSIEIVPRKAIRLITPPNADMVRSWYINQLTLNGGLR